MKITYKGDYALKAILDLSMRYGEAETIENIAKRQDIPIKFLEQILLELKKGGFVLSQRGRFGGYMLAKMPGEISMGEVLRHIEGPIEPIDCSQCDFSSRCYFCDVFEEIGKYTTNKLEKLNFAELSEKQMRKAARNKKYLDYVI